MIFIDREKTSIPTILTDENGVGKKEREKNSQYAENGEWDKIVFFAYKHNDVREALIKLFNAKCAYCESRFLHVYTGDIEHFRPKGKIEEASPNQKPGYYWLAAEWSNLLLSCRHCNQTYKHKIFNEVSKKGLGKLNQFPLDEGGEHIQNHIGADEKIKEEEEKYRLLINPCIENPEDYFQYTDIGVIKPKKTEGRMFIMAQKSIFVYVLQRMPLVQAREKVLIEIYAQIQRVIEATKNLDTSMKLEEEKSNRVIYDKVLKRELTRLRLFMNDEEEYAGMARQIIDGFIQKHFD